MKDIEELIQNVDKYKNIVVQKRFVSKKNTVAYVIFGDKPRVIKWYAPAFTKQMETEYDILKQGSSKFNTPLALEKDTENNVLMMSYVSGRNLCP